MGVDAADTVEEDTAKPGISEEDEQPIDDVPPNDHGSSSDPLSNERGASGKVADEKINNDKEASSLDAEQSYDGENDQDPIDTLERAINRSHLVKSPVSAGTVNYHENKYFGYNHKGSEQEDPTYSVKSWGEARAFDRPLDVAKARERLLSDRIIFLSSSTAGAITAPLYALLNELQSEFSFRTYRSGSFDIDIYRSNLPSLRYDKPTVTYLNLYNARCDAEPLAQSEYAAELQSHLAKKNNHLILLIDQDVIDPDNQVDSVHAPSQLFTWSIIEQAEQEPPSVEFSLDVDFGATLEFLVTFFPGLCAHEIDSLVRELNPPQQRIKENEGTKKLDDVNQESNSADAIISSSITWENSADQIAQERGIACTDREGVGFGYYYDEIERETQTRRLLLERYPQFVHSKIRPLLRYFFSSSESSPKFGYGLNELLVTIERRRTYSPLSVELFELYQELATEKCDEAVIHRFRFLVRQLDRHPSTRRIVDQLVRNLVQHAQIELTQWDGIVQSGVDTGDENPTLQDINTWLESSTEVVAKYERLAQQLKATYFILIEATDWRTGHRLIDLHRLTSYEQRRRTHGNYLTKGVGLIALYAHLLYDFQSMPRYGRIVLDFHQEEARSADLFLDAFNLAVRQIVNNCVFDDDWTAAEGFLGLIASDEGDELADIIAEVALTKAPYKPSEQRLMLVLTGKGASLSLSKTRREKNLKEIAHFYEKLATALVKYTDNRARYDGDRKLYLRQLIRKATQPLSQRLKSKERRDFRAALTEIQTRAKAYRSTHTFKRGSRRHTWQVLTAEAMRILLGSLSQRSVPHK